MAMKYAHPNKHIVLSGLKKGHSILDMQLWNEDWDQPSKVAVKMVTLWCRYHKVYFTLETMQHWVNAPSTQAVKDSLKVVDKRWKLFWYDAKKQQYLPHKKETDKQLKRRAQRIIRNQVALGWVTRDLIEYMGNDGKAWPRAVITPHTNQQFMKQVGCSEPTVTRYLNQMVEVEGYALRYEGNGRHKSYFVRPDHDDDEDMMPQMEERYFPHKPTHLTAAKRALLEADSAPLDPATLARLHRLRDKQKVHE